MTELPRLTTVSSDEFELALLRSVEIDTPPRSAMGRTAAALGIGAGAVIAPVSAAAAGSSTLTPIGGIVWASLLKAGAVGFASGLLVVGGVAAVSLHSSTASVRPTAASHTAPSPVRALAPPAALEPQRAPAREPSPIDEPRGPTPARSTPPSIGLPAPIERSNTPAPLGQSSPSEVQPQAKPTALDRPSSAALPGAPAPSSISEEVASIDRARAALARGQAREALTELELYRKRWPRGVLALDALVVRVEAEVKLGDRAGAEREATPVIAAYPASRYAAQLRALLGTSTSR